MSRNYAGLSRERIIVEALHIIAGRGLGGLSMRRLGDALDVEAMAIYHHFPKGKEQLFNAIAAYVTTARVVSGLAEGQGPPGDVDGAEGEEATGTDPVAAAGSDDLPWDRRLTVWAEAYRERLLTYSGALSLLMHRAPHTLGEEDTRALLHTALTEAGLAEDDVSRACDALNAYCLGSVAHQVRHSDREDAPDASEALAGFRFGLRALLRGLAG
ncbi:TetR/AcrR family transcriptional regulator [Nocardiopsis sp. L17-MgMaSL7]|uniref:TetR/AcrR family transcriptional regulator n=1 Tax=Nocardiopsis sp. L17-MgMaSL7 TaxID=1938893 RepID=UPI000D71D3CF|nr:TetR/AcrR family transcriptional regulator [Nocardiopsis sp. L17-MgMaSL7]PWV55492.1 TetR family transcriptional regulator [Nocardiopsis sp. L17-MgMaSL7]